MALITSGCVPLQAKLPTETVYCEGSGVISRGTIHQVKAQPLPRVFPLPSRRTHCLCRVFPLPSRLRHRICHMFPLPSLRRHRLCHTFPLPSLRRHRPYPVLPLPLRPRHCSCLVFPLPSRLRHRLCRVYFHCPRGQDTAFASCPIKQNTAFAVCFHCTVPCVSKALPLPCVATALAAKTMPLPCVSTALAAKTMPFRAVLQCFEARLPNLVSGTYSVGLTGRRRDCHFADALSPSLLKRLLRAEGGAAA